MKITSIKVYKIGLPLKEGSYKWSHNSEIKEWSWFNKNILDDPIKD